MTTWQHNNPAYEVDPITHHGNSPRPISGAGYPPQPTAAGYPAPQQTAVGYPTQPTPGVYPPRPISGGYQPQQTAVSYQPQPTPGGYPVKQTPNNYPLVQPATGSFSTQQNVAQPPPLANQNLSTVSNTTVIIQQPKQQTEVALRGTQTWSSGLCNCCDDCGLCFLGFCFPRCLECYVSCEANECCCAASFCPIALRTSVRERYYIKGDLCDDCLVMTFCSLCGLCQMGRELKFRK